MVAPQLGCTFSIEPKLSLLYTYGPAALGEEWYQPRSIMSHAFADRALSLNVREGTGSPSRD